MLPKWKENDFFKGFSYDCVDFVQQNGQLMGHVLSFITLCIANICSYWKSREDSIGRKISLAELQEKYFVYVNGDDILFKSDDRHYKQWLSTIKEFGFEPSVGKNFFTDKFLQINSQLYRIDTYFDEECMETKLKELVFIPFVNFGFITNRAKNDCSKDLTVQRIGMQGLEEDSMIGRLKSMGFIRSKLIDGLSSKIREKVISLFDCHTRPTLEHFGLLSLKKYLFSDVFSESLSAVVKNLKDPDSDKYTALNELSSKLDRGVLSFEFSLASKLKREHREQCFWNLWDFEELGIPKPKATSWIAV